MDQVKVYLGVAKKHHFWILAVVVVVTAVAVWAKASSSLKQVYDTHSRQIDAAEKSVEGAGQGERVNELFSQKVEKLHGDLKDRVFDAWQKLYEHQVALFKWPVRKTDDGNVIDLNNLKPGEEIPQYVRTFYNENVVREEWEELLSKVDIRRPKEFADETEDENSDSAEEEVVKRGTEYQGLVVWKENLRKAIVSRYYTPNASPSTIRLRMMQEDAWLFDSLIHIVNTVNFGATDPLRAPIKQIDTLDVAQWAIAASLESGTGIFVPGGSPGAGPSAPAAPAMPTPTAGAAPGAATAGATAAASADNDADWKEGRYLDEKGEPLKGESQPYAEFKQMFVYMKFIMDQRRIPDLVAACANAPLPIETRQIRVQTLKDGDTGGAGLFPSGGGPMGGGPMGGGPMGGGPMGGGPMGGGPMGGMPMGGMPMGGMPMGGMPAGGPQMKQQGTASMPPAMVGGGPMGGMPMGGMPMGGMPMGGMPMGGMPMGGGMFGVAAPEGGVEVTVYDAVVELSGVIYLYQPPDVTKLGTGGAGAPEKRSFGVPKTSVRVPGTGGGLSSAAGPNP